MKFSSADEKFMCEALRLAESMRGRTGPDPMVGAVLVKNGKIVSRGYHAEVTTPHAETFAIQKAGKKARGTTLYLNLEPCCHWGNNPPCTTNIINAGIKEVVAAMADPNSLVSGRGFQKLREAGIKVRVGLLREEATKLNEVFVKYITTGRPYVFLKAAMSLDGKIATRTGESFWITGKETRNYTRWLRGTVGAVMVGIGTVLKDNPYLSVVDMRSKKGRTGKKVHEPLKIILDTKLKIPLRANVLRYFSEHTVVVSGRKASSAKAKKIEALGAEVLRLPESRGHINLAVLMKELGQHQVPSVLIEGGGKVNAAALAAKVVDKVLFFVAPRIIGGKDAPTSIEGEGIASLSRALKIKDLRVRRIGEDLFCEGYIAS